MSLEIIKHLQGQEFILSKVRYTVIGLKEVTGRMVIKTDKRIFTFYPSEVEDWLGEIVIVDKVQEVEANDAALYARTLSGDAMPVESAVVVSKKETHNAGILEAINQSQSISNSLASVFAELCGEPSEALYKKAKAMSDMSNSIVNVQMAQYKLLTLKK